MTLMKACDILVETENRREMTYQQIYRLLLASQLINMVLISILLLSRKAKNPYVPKGPHIINIFFVVSFRKPVADPLATLRDHLVSKKTLRKRQVIPQSLHLIGMYLAIIVLVRFTWLQFRHRLYCYPRSHDPALLKQLSYDGGCRIQPKNF